MVNYDELDPGIRETVRRLNEWGFETTDSGDGVTKGEDGESVPHVYVRCEAHHMISVARQLKILLERAGFCVEPVGPGDGIFIQATYDPANESAIVAVVGVRDSAWRS